MSIALSLVLRLVLWLLLAPLVPGIINKVKAWVAGRRGPPVLQLYYDLAKLWRKGVVMSTAASPGHIAGVAVAWVAVVGAALLVPVGTVRAWPAFGGDALLFVYLLALARFCTSSAAMETGSAFEGMGVAREVSFAILAEAALITALLTLSLQTGSVSLTTMLAPSAGAGAALLAAGLFTVLLAENCRVPFDDPNTHLELTMIHEVMVLDHSGPPLAAILHGAALKLLLFSVLLAEAVLPIGELAPLTAAGALAGAVLVVAVAAGLVESLLARFAFRRVPLLLTTAFLLCLFALLAAWKGSAAVPAAATSAFQGSQTNLPAPNFSTLRRLGQPRSGESNLKPSKLIPEFCAAPGPVLRFANELRFHWVAFDVANCLGFVDARSHVSVPVIFGPEFAAPVQQLVHFVGCKFLPRLDNGAHGSLDNFEQDMDMVGHDHPGQQFIALVVKEAESTLDNGSHFCAAQETFSPTTVEIGFDLPALLPVFIDFQQRLPLGAQCSREAVGQSEGDELRQTGSVAVRQVTPPVPATEVASGMGFVNWRRPGVLCGDQVPEAGIMRGTRKAALAVVVHGGSKTSRLWRGKRVSVDGKLMERTLLRLGQPRSGSWKGSTA